MGWRKSHPALYHPVCLPCLIGICGQSPYPFLDIVHAGYFVDVPYIVGKAAVAQCLGIVILHHAELAVFGIRAVLTGQDESQTAVLQYVSCRTSLCVIVALSLKAASCLWLSCAHELDEGAE